MIIAVCTQKGGVSKTTTAQAIATGAAKIGRRSLAIDIDPQANLSYGMSANIADIGTYELITGRATPAQTIQHTKQGDVIAGSQRLAELDLYKGDDRPLLLAKAIKPIKRKYDVIVIDCPPALNIQLVNALMAADTVVIPITADIYALQGLYQLQKNIQDAQKENKNLKIGGALITKYNTRTKLDREVSDVVRARCEENGIHVYDTKIRLGVAVPESQLYRENLFTYAPKSNAAIDYMNFVHELKI